MQVLFTKNNSIVSRLIRRLTGEPVSHCAIEYLGNVYHSNFYGVHMESLQNFLQGSNQIVLSIEAQINPYTLADAMYQYRGSKYDFGGLLYVGLRILIPALPKYNLWQSTGMFMCTEWVEQVTGLPPDAMLTPYGLYKLLTSNKQGDN